MTRKRKRGRKYELAIEFTLGTTTDSDVEIWAGALSHSAGTFLPTNTRDMQFTFPSSTAARAAVERIRAHVQLLSHAIYPVAEEDEEGGA